MCETSDEIIDNNLNDDQEEEEEDATETISLTNFPITQDQDHHNNPPSSSLSGDLFEFFSQETSDHSEDKMMSHAEDIIFCGKLVPINDQLHHNKLPQQPVGCRRSCSDSMADIKTKTTITSPLVRTSRSLDYKKLNRNSSMTSEPAADISRDGSGKKSLSSRWYVLFFGLVKVPPSEMDIRDIKNRQVRRTSSKSPLVSSESCKVVPVTGSDDQRKCSWRVLGILSCKSSSSVAVTPPVGKKRQ